MSELRVIPYPLTGATADGPLTAIWGKPPIGWLLFLGYLSILTLYAKAVKFQTYFIQHEFLSQSFSSPSEVTHKDLIYKKPSAIKIIYI